MFLSAAFHKESQIYFSFIYIGVIFTLIQFFDTLYSIKLSDVLFLNGGDIAYSALIFVSIFLILSQPEPRVIRNLFYFVLIIDFFIAFIIQFVIYILKSEWGVGFTNSGENLLEFSFPSLIFSLFLFIGEILILLVCFRRLLPKIKNQMISTLLIVLLFMLILILDGILYPVGINIIIPNSNYSVTHGILAKLIFGAGFGTLLFLYLNIFPTKLSHFLEEQTSFIYYFLPPKQKALIQKYKEATNEIKLLRQFLPICVRCKKIRDDAGYWTEVDQYLRQHSDLKFSHGYCEKCFAELHPDYANEVLEEIKQEKSKN